MITRRLKAQYFQHLKDVKEVGSLMPAWHSEIIPDVSLSVARQL